MSLGGDFLSISDIVANYLLRIIDDADGDAEIQRNELANTIGCVPSQINYVITSRFTPEHGYMVESKRGGGGYIRITRIKTDKTSALMHIINSVGDHIDASATGILLESMLQRDMISKEIYRLMLCALAERSYANVPIEFRDSLRANIFKNMLLTLI